MNKSGHLLIETLLGLAILALITVTFLPIFTYTNYNFYLLKAKNDMKYYGETIMERFKAFDYFNDSEEYVLDMSMVDIIDMFNEEDYVDISLPISGDSEFDYCVKIEKKNRCEKLWDVEITIISKNNSERLKNVCFKSLLQKPYKQ
ncbi:hypothetical protein [Anaerosalibacter sp. Marseille-P3206]|uniref:hypothetical protein n=1 Tax=Anaerosalibacter sp. Marseille-P3206 TaxID=1871005 RepID=UPI000986761E|nr:hypothetical protein [Anaerosalibacter sp. Marseille-P3206]